MRMCMKNVTKALLNLSGVRRFGNKEFENNLFVTPEILKNLEEGIYRKSGFKAQTFLQKNLNQVIKSSAGTILNNRDIQGKLNFRNLRMIELPIPEELKNVRPKLLTNGLDVVVKNECLMSLEEVNKFAPTPILDFFSNLPQEKEIDKMALADYIPPSQDPLLHSLARKHKCKYICSTSTVVGFLCHISFLITGFQFLNFHLEDDAITDTYLKEPLRYMISHRKPSIGFVSLISQAPIILGVDSTNEFLGESDLIFLKMGRYFEEMFKHQPEEFRKIYMNPGNQPKKGEPDNEYHTFLHVGNMMLRSQIDSVIYDKNKLMRKVEIKTRAVAPQRYDAENYDKFLDYSINSLKGIAQSFEREHYDLIRGAFDKYLHQINIGNMSGVLIAYHNTKKVFGFEYFPKWYLEKRIYGNQEFAQICYKVCYSLFEKLMDFIFSDQQFTNQNNKFKMGVQTKEKRGRSRLLLSHTKADYPEALLYGNRDTQENIKRWNQLKAHML